jgi:hypothetical protein
MQTYAYSRKPIAAIIIRDILYKCMSCQMSSLSIKHRLFMLRNVSAQNVAADNCYYSRRYFIRLILRNKKLNCYNTWIKWRGLLSVLWLFVVKREIKFRVKPWMLPATWVKLFFAVSNNCYKVSRFIHSPRHFVLSRGLLFARDILW